MSLRRISETEGKVHAWPAQCRDIGGVRAFLESGESVDHWKILRPEKVAWMRKVLQELRYHTLSREEKGAVRQFLAKTTGYSRAQVERHIAMQRVNVFVGGAAGSAGRMWYGTALAAAALVALPAASLLLWRAQFIQQERELPLAASVSQDAEEAADGQRAVSLPLEELRSMRQRKDNRRIARIRASGSQHLAAAEVAEGTAAEAFSVPLANGDEVRSMGGLARPRRSRLVAGLERLWDAIGPAEEGQVLIFRKGVPVWEYMRTPPTVVRVQRGGVGRSGGGGGGQQDMSGSDGRLERHDHQTADGGGILDINGATQTTLASGRGGTSFSAYATGDLLVGKADGTLEKVAIGSNGQVLSVANGTARWGSAGAGDLTYAAARTYFVDDSGDTMTGGLLIQNGGAPGAIDAAILLEVLGTASGRHLHAADLLTASGAVRTSSGITLNEDLDAADVALVFGSDTLSESLSWVNLADRFEFSDDVRITGGTYASGTLIVDGAAILKSTLKLNGVTYTFPTSDGSASGKVLKTNAAGQLSWSADANDGASGITYANAVTYFLPDSGGSLTGALLIQTKTNGSAATADAGVQLEVVGTASGDHLHAQALLTVSGAVRTSSGITLNEDLDAADVALVFGSDTLSESLSWVNLADRFEFSDDLHVTGNLTSSGTLKADGNITTEGDLTLNQDQTNANTVLTFGSDTINETLTFLNAADEFRFSDDLATTGYLSGALLTVNGQSSLYGGLTVSGAAILKSTLKLNGVTYTFPTSDGSASGKVLKTNAAGQLSWSADANDGASGITYANAVTYFLPDSGGSLTGALLIQTKTNGAAALADAGVQLEIVGVASGSVLYASSGINSSGAVIIKTPVTTSATLGGTGALVVMQRIELGTGAYMSASGAAILALDSPVQGDTAPAPSNTPHIAFGYQGKFDTNLYRMTGSVLRTDDNVSIGGDVAVNEAITTLESSNIPAGSIVIGNGILCIDDGGSNCDDSVRTAGTMYSVNVAVTPLDLAENYPTKDATLAAGEIVALDSLLPFFVKRAEGGRNEAVIGVVSTAPGIILGGFDEGGFANERQVPVALAGRVPVRVHAEGGPIAIGDHLTLSSIAGTAKRSNGTDQFIGVALEAFTGPTTGTIDMFVQRGEKRQTEEASGIAILSSDAGGSSTEEITGLLDAVMAEADLDQRIAEGIREQLAAEDLHVQIEDMFFRQAQTVRTQGEQGAQDVFGAPAAFIVGKDLSIADTAYLRGGLRVEGATRLDGPLFLAEPLLLTGGMRARGTVTASDVEVERTLTVLGDARVSGDLHLEGALRVSDLFVPGTMRIDGGAEIGGTLRAEKIIAGSGSQIQGALLLAGDLLVGGRSLLLGSGSTLRAQDIVVEKAIIILGNITVEGLATFAGDVDIRGELRVSGQQAGYAVIPRGGTGVLVRFGTGFTAVPVVTASPDVPVLYAVSRATQSGFMIRITGPAPEPVTFSWLALLTHLPKVHGESARHTIASSSGDILSTDNTLSSPFLAAEGSAVSAVEQSSASSIPSPSSERPEQLQTEDVPANSVEEAASADGVQENTEGVLVEESQAPVPAAEGSDIPAVEQSLDTGEAPVAADSTSSVTPPPAEHPSAPLPIEEVPAPAEEAASTGDIQENTEAPPAG